MQKLTNVSQNIRPGPPAGLLPADNELTRPDPTGAKRESSAIVPIVPLARRGCKCRAAVPAARAYCCSRMRSMRRSGSAAPHSNWSPIVNAPR